MIEECSAMNKNESKEWRYYIEREERDKHEISAAAAFGFAMICTYYI